MKGIVKFGFIAAALSALIMSGCYSSDYNAVGFVHSNTSHEAYMDFYKFDGRIVFDLDADDGEVSYSGELESGEITVSYDADGEKTELFSLKAGEQINDILTLPKGSSVYIIVETESPCENGELNFNT